MQAHLVLPAFVSGIADPLFMTGFRYSFKHFDRFPVFISLSTLDCGRERSDGRLMENAQTIEFWITRNGRLTADGEVIGQFGSEAAAADVAIRFAQDAGALYRLFYPL